MGAGDEEGVGRLDPSALARAELPRVAQQAAAGLPRRIGRCFALLDVLRTVAEHFADAQQEAAWRDRLGDAVQAPPPPRRELDRQYAERGARPQPAGEGVAPPPFGLGGPPA